MPRVLPEGKLPDDSRLGPLKTLNGYFPFTPPKTREEWEQRADQVRRQVQVATGLWPMPEKTPLNAVVYGKVDREGYTVEKVYFESYPGHFVTGSLYRPKGATGKLPGVLCPYGHFRDGRFNELTQQELESEIANKAERFEVGGRYPLQAYPVQLARMGCIAFQYDLEGYCDSVQIPMSVAHDHTKFRPEMDTPHDWGFFSTQAELRLQSIMGLQTYNSVRALDFLCEVADADPNRLGVTGASGGGTQTIILCAIDQRPDVAVPAVMVSTAMQGGCTCENCELLRIDTGNVEFAGLFAPKPLSAIAARDWTQELATKGGPELEQLYSLLGAKDNVQIKPFLKFGHNFNYVSRGAMYEWMNKQLKLGVTEPVVEEDFVPLSRAELSVWDDQHSKPASGEDYERSLLHIMTDDSNRQLAKLAPHDQKTLAAFRHILGGAWDVLIGRGMSKPAEIEFEQVDETVRHEQFLQKKGLLRYKPAHEEVPIVVLQPRGETRRTALWIDPAGKAALFDCEGSPKPTVLKLLENGVQVVGLDLFGQGEFLPDGETLTKTRTVTSGKKVAAAFTFGYNRAVFAERVHDVLTAASYFRGDDQPLGVVDVVGLNGAGHWAAAAKAIAGKAIDRAVIGTAGFRFGNVHSTDDPDFLPGAVKYEDVPGLLALCAPSEIWVADPASSQTKPEIVESVYQAAGVPSAITWYIGPADELEATAVEWLMKN
jgi:Abhydrolase family